MKLLSAQAPASFVAWDLLALGDNDLRNEPLAVRHERLEHVLAGVAPPVHLPPATRDRALAADWFRRFEGAGLDGVMAKRLDAPYRAGERIPRVALSNVPAVRVKASASTISPASRWDNTKDALTKRRRQGSPMRATRKPEEIDANQNAGEKSQRGKANPLLKPLHPSEELAAVVGSDPLPRGQVVSKMWEYIRLHNLQNPENRREILADDKLRRVFGKDKVTMFEMNKHLAGHLK